MAEESKLSLLPSTYITAKPLKLVSKPLKLVEPIELKPGLPETDALRKHLNNARRK